MLNTNEPTLPPDVLASVVNALADTLIRDYRERWSRRTPEAPKAPLLQLPPAAIGESPWLTAVDAAKRARCGRSTLYEAVRTGRLQVARFGRILRIRPECVDEWLQAASTQR